MNLRFGSLFAGVGGFDCGFEKAGWECAWQVEWDANCQSVLQHRWPYVNKHLDVSDVDGFRIDPVDVITFGSPCQDLSVAGKRAGLDGERSSLFFQATRIIKEMRYATGNRYPRIAIWENVPGALTSNEGEDFGAVLDEMANVGALAIEWHVLDAQWFGIPHRRRRVFVVACFDPAIVESCGQQILPVPEDSSGNLKKVRKKRKSDAAAIKNGSGGTVHEAYGFSQKNGIDIQASPTAFPPIRKESGGVSIAQNIESYVKVIRSGARDAEGNLPPEVWAKESISPTLNAFDNNSESRSTILVLHQEREDRDFYRMLAFGKYAEDDTASTMKARDYKDVTDIVSHHVNNGYLLRRLTPVECERLMGFDDNHTLVTNAKGKPMSDSNRYKMMGNAVAVPVAQWIAENIKIQIEKSDTINTKEK